jgi:type I restriction enzyme S subunit
MPTTEPLGALIDKSHRPPELSEDDEVWNLNLDQIEPHSGRVLAKRMVNTSDLGPSTFAFDRGTVLYSKLRPYLNKVVLADDAGVATTELVPLRCDSSRLDACYLAHFLRGPEFLRFATNVVAGAKMPRMVMSEFWKFPVPLPPLPEQRRIAAILDQADALRAKRREALVQLDSLTQSIFIEMFGDPATNPMNWEVVTLESIATKVTDGEHLTPRRTSSGIKLLSARNVRDGYLDFGDVDYVDEAEYQRISKRCNPEPDDILISCSGSIGRVAIVETAEPLALVRSAALVKPDRRMIGSMFLETYLRSAHLNRLMIKSAHSSSQANLFQGPIRSLPVFLPRPDLQQLFEERYRAVRKIRAGHAEATRELDALFASLQHRAFTGAL